MKKIVIVDYGLGNIYNVERAFKYCGAENIEVSGDATKIKSADKIVLPGVGAFSRGIDNLKNLKLDEAIKEYAATGREILGICLGMQLLGSTSEEFVFSTGLNLIPGQVAPIEKNDIEGRIQKVPFIGWSQINLKKNKLSKHTLLNQMTENDRVYLIHSYHFIPSEKENILATYSYGGRNIVAAIIKDNIIGLQFHPEKSGKVGLKILSNFISS